MDWGETIKNGNGQIWVANSFERVFDSVFPNTNTKKTIFDGQNPLNK